MAILLEDLLKELKVIRDYLIKIGPSRRKGTILETKTSEANKLYERYTNCLSQIDEDIKSGKIISADVPAIENVSEKINQLYYNILELCKETPESNIESVVSKSNMTTFELKTALSLLPVMTDEEGNTKQLIDNIQYYNSILTQTTCKQNLINFVLKSRLSQVAKLKLKEKYSTVDELVKDMQTELLPKKAATAIQSRMQKIRQNELSVSDFGKELSELFVDLTVSQANGNTECYNILKPINEKYAIKQFSDGLRNRRLSTIISARNYSSLKDAVQAALDEETTPTLASGDIMGMSRSNNYNSRNNRGHKRGFMSNRGGYNNRFSSFRPRYQSQHSSGQQNRGWYNQPPARSRGTRGRPHRGTYYNSNRSQGIRRQHNVHAFTDSVSENQNVTQNVQRENDTSNWFFRD